MHFFSLVWLDIITLSLDAGSGRKGSNNVLGTGPRWASGLSQYCSSYVRSSPLAKLRVPPRLQMRSTILIYVNLATDIEG